MIHDALAFSKNVSKHSVAEDVHQITRIIVANDVKDILDLGCGIGVLAKSLCDCGIAVHLVDGSSEMLAIAREKVCPRGSIVQANIVALPYKEGAAASAVLSFVLHHLNVTQRSACLTECSRVLRKGSRLFIVERAPRSQLFERIFPVYWRYLYRYEHEWPEECPVVRTVERQRLELEQHGFALIQKSTIREPIRKAVKFLTIPKTVIVAVKHT